MIPLLLSALLAPAPQGYAPYPDLPRLLLPAQLNVGMPLDRPDLYDALMVCTPLGPARSRPLPEDGYIAVQPVRVEDSRAFAPGTVVEVYYPAIFGPRDSPRPEGTPHRPDRRASRGRARAARRPRRQERGVTGSRPHLGAYGTASPKPRIERATFGLGRDVLPHRAGAARSSLRSQSAVRRQPRRRRRPHLRRQRGGDRRVHVELRRAEGPLSPPDAPRTGSPAP